MNVTDPEYRLPIIQPLRFNEHFTSSANKPLLITGVDTQTGEKGDYVVKFRASERMSSEASMRELIAAFIAKQIEIPIVEPVIVDVDAEFVELLKRKDVWSVANKSIGYNYGSTYVSEMSTLVIDQPLSPAQLEHAQQIVAFDVFIQNSDRTNNKPNMLTNGKEIVILDHEIAFGFVFDLFPNPQPWLIREADMQWINNHCLLKKVQGKSFEWQAFGEKLDRLDGNFWATALAHIPEEWRSEQFDTIRGFLSQICEHRDDFINELKKVFA